MDIRTLQLIEGARQARGLTVIIDVFRACSVACYVFDNGADRIIPLEDVDDARAMKEEHPDFVLMGERGGKRVEGFDYGNSPSEIEHIDFTDKVVLHTTSAGTRGLSSAIDADVIITGSFVNVSAVIAYISQEKPDTVSLVCMGDEAERETDEDTLCAEYMRDLLERKSTDFREIVRHLRHYETARKFFDPEQSWAPERDFELCMALDRFNFLIRAEKDSHGLLQLRKFSPSGA